MLTWIKSHKRASLGVAGCAMTWLGTMLMVRPAMVLLVTGLAMVACALLSMIPPEEHGYNSDYDR
jgi:hypothetical protein